MIKYKFLENCYKKWSLFVGCLRRKTAISIYMFLPSICLKFSRYFKCFFFLREDRNQTKNHVFVLDKCKER